MGTIEPQLPGGDDLAADPASVDILQVQPVQDISAEWSVRARQCLTWAVAFGVVLTLLGVYLLLDPARFQLVDSAARGLVGLYTIPFGLAVVYLAARTRSSAPDQLYQLRSTGMPRRWFILLWAISTIVFLVLAAQHGPVTRPLSWLFLMLPLVLMSIGGLWCFRWLGNKLSAEWPTGQSDAPAALPLRWPQLWPIMWLGLWGIGSIVVAAGLESLVFDLATPIIGSKLNLFGLTAISTSNPVRVMIILLLASVFAPAIEEACKAFGLRFFRGAIHRPIDGLIFGVVAGMGFGLAEGTLYLVYLAGAGLIWSAGAWLRLVGVLLHGLTTSIVGLAYSRSLRTGNRRDLWMGYGRAVLVHGMWNALAIGSVVVLGQGQPLFGLMGAILLIGLVVKVLPGIAMAGAQASVQEGYDQANVPLPPEWSPMDNGISWRLIGSRPIFSERPAVVTTPNVPQPTGDDEYVQRVERTLKDL